MGYIAHDAAIAVVHDDDIVKALDDFQRRLAEERPDIRPFFVGPIQTVNYDSIFAFLPDGSKEGWGLSDDSEEWRQEFIKIAHGALDDNDGDPYYEGGDVVHVRFGGDYGVDMGTQVVFTTDTATSTLV